TTTRSNRGISPRSRRERSSRSSSARSPRSEQHTQPFLSSTVRSSTRRSRWWSMPTSPSSFTITAVSPSAGCSSSREISVVLPLPRKPVTTTTGSFDASGKRAHELGVERIERPACEPLGLHPQRPEVRDDGRPALQVAQQVDPAAPVVETQPELAEHPVHEPDAEDAGAPAAARLGPVLARERSTEGAHCRSVLPLEREETWPRRSS